MGPERRLPPPPEEALVPNPCPCPWNRHWVEGSRNSSRLSTLKQTHWKGSFPTCPPWCHPNTLCLILSPVFPLPWSAPPTPSTTLGQGDSGCLLQQLRECERLPSSTANGAWQLEAGETSLVPLSPIMSHWSRGAMKPQ